MSWRAVGKDFKDNLSSWDVQAIGFTGLFFDMLHDLLVFSDHEISAQLEVLLGKSCKSSGCCLQSKPLVKILNEMVETVVALALAF